MIRINYKNLANIGRKFRKGISTPGFEVEGKFIFLETMMEWAGDDITFIPGFSKYRTQDREKMNVWDDPRTIAGCLQMVRETGNGMDLIRKLKAA